jgi:hypothetical protein
LAKSDSTSDEFQSIYSTVLANPSHEKVYLVIAMSVAMAYIKKRVILILRLNIVMILRSN